MEEINIKYNLFYADSLIRSILNSTISIAIVGLSDKENRPSYFAAQYLKSKGYKIFPINPFTKEKFILGEKVLRSLNDLKSAPDMVDLFVNKTKINCFVNEAIKLKTKTIWLQLGLFDLASEKKAKKKGINFIMNRCPKIEYARLSGELSWAGINTEVISNQKILLKK